MGAVGAESGSVAMVIAPYWNSGLPVSGKAVATFDGGMRAVWEWARSDHADDLQLDVQMLRDMAVLERVYREKFGGPVLPGRWDLPGVGDLGGMNCAESGVFPW